MRLPVTQKGPTFLSDPFNNYFIFKVVHRNYCYLSIVPSIINGMFNALDIRNNISNLGLIKPALILPIVDLGTPAKLAGDLSQLQK